MLKSLVAFDFDHTIVGDNSDTAVIDLLGKPNIPAEIRSLQHNEGWTAFMQGVFDIAFEKGLSPEVMKQHVSNLPPVEGMIELITELNKTGTYDIIIISDSNTLFIDSYLEKHSLQKCIMQVFSNPAEFIDGRLKISPYHNQENCKLSTRNLCKGQILEEFVAEQKKKEISYNKIIYIGDGVNDFCPILRLNNEDLACVRNKFRLYDIVIKARQGLSFDNSGQPHVLRAEIVVWDTGDDILKKLKK